MHPHHEKRYPDSYGQHSSHMHHCHMIEYQCESQNYPDPGHILCSKQFTIHEKAIVPCTKPDIEEVLEVKAYPYIEKCKVIETPFGHKLIIIGRVEQKIVYVADVSCQSVHVFHALEPFCIFFEMPHGSWCSSEHHSHPSQTHVCPSGNYHSGTCIPDSSICRSSSHHHDHNKHPWPHVLLEFLCAQQTGPREVSKCMVLMIWFPGAVKPPCPPPSPEPPIPCEAEQYNECSSCKYFENCPFRK